MDHPKIDVCPDQQPVVHIDRVEAKPNTPQQHQQHSPHSHQEQHSQHSPHSHQEQHQPETPESLLHQEQQADDVKQVKDEYIHTHIKKHFDFQQMQESHELKPKDTEELELQQRKDETQMNQELQAQEDVPDLQAMERQELQTQQTEEKQTQEHQKKQPCLNQELPTDHNKEQHKQLIPTVDEAQLSILVSGQHQNQPSTQHQKPQLSPKDLQQRQQEQHIKKLKKKLVGENQERINFLAQASRSMALTAASSAGVTGQRALAAQVGSLASAVGRRCVLRLAPALKRCLCKGCGTALVYGLNARVRHRSRRQKHVVVTCLTCHTIKRFVNDPRHKLWFEQEEALV